MLVDDHTLVREGVSRLLEEEADMRVVAAFADGHAAVRFAAREVEVLKLVVEGNTSVQMATQLGLSPKSIDTYRSRLMSKLDLDDLPALVKFAIRRGLTSA
jgi:DNA-binding NarL/FixJ family response regulator